MSLTLKPIPWVKNRCDRSWSVEPSTTCPSLRGRTAASRRMPGARVPGLASMPGALYGGAGVGSRVTRGDLDLDGDLGARVDGAHARGALGGDAEGGQRGGDPVQVVRVVGADADRTAARP